MIAGKVRPMLWRGVLAGVLAACAAEPEGGVPREAQAAECAAVVAAHVGAAPRAVAVAWAGMEPGGGSVFEVTDGGRLHTCHVDAGGRVHEIRHPGAEE